MRKIAFLVIAPILILALHIGFLSHNASAQQTKSISIAPLREESEVRPGLAHDGVLLIKNSGDKTQRIDLSAETFNVINQAYDYVFVPDTTEAKWVAFEKTSLTLNPGKSVTVSYRVNVPIDAEPAGYYLALFALNRPATGSTGGVSSTERVASLLYLTVLGDATRAGNLVTLQSPTVIFDRGNWSATIQNTGSLHFRSTYKTSIQSVFGNQLTSTEDSRLILPNSVRLIDSDLSLPPILGLYKVVYSVSLGDSPGREETRYFLYLPLVQTLLIIAIIGSLVVLFRKRRS